MNRIKSIFVFVIIIYCLVASQAAAAPSANATSMLGPYTTNDITISSRESIEWQTAVAYNRIHNEYLVVWENIGGSYDIYAQRVSADGRLLSWFVVSKLPNNKTNPSVAYDEAYDRYLVVYQYDYYGNGSDWDIYGRFIPWDGPTDTFVDFTICSWIANQGRPQVAYAWWPGIYMVVWINYSGGQPPSYVSARRINANGGFLGDGFLVSQGSQSRNDPAIAYLSKRNEFLIVWDVKLNEMNSDIYGIRLPAFEAPPVGGEINIAGWDSYEIEPSVAACHAADQYLVTWQSDQSTGKVDYAIYARFLPGDGVAGDVTMIADTSLDDIKSSVSCDYYGNKYLVAWQEKHVGELYGIRARMVHPNGSMEPDFEVAGPAGTNGNRLNPSIGGGKQNFLIAWEHYRDDGTNLDIHGRLIGYFLRLPLVMK